MEYNGVKKSFIAYEYKEIVAQSNKASFLLDGYENFGWEVDKNLSEAMVENRDLPHQNKVILRLKRNRKIINILKHVSMKLRHWKNLKHQRQPCMH